jgi:uncharacterized protein (DUF1015 family)
MPRIKPFYALKPVISLQNRVVTRPLENYSLGQARLMVSENPYSFLHLINPELDNPYLRGSRQELIYKKIAENLDSFIDNKVLLTEEKPAIYIYQVENDGLVQSGIWTITHINDYLDGNIKKHELTVERRERLLSEYIEQTGLDANPVLITYAPDQKIDEIIANYQNLEPNVDLTYEDGTIHRLWIVNEHNDLETLIQSFKNIPVVYIADGHHRIAAMAKMSLHKRSLSMVDENANFNYFSTAYFSTDQVKVLEYNRLVKDLGELTIDQFIAEVEKSFELIKVDFPVKCLNMHGFGMYLSSGWYQLIARTHIYDKNDPISVLDVSILQDYILKPILNINDPRTDARITFEGGKTPITALQSQVDHGNYAVAFTLFPTSVQQLINVADANGVMPPKSTWVEPKFLVGMLTNYFV